LLNCKKMRLVLVGYLAVIVIRGGIVKADFTWTQKTEMPIKRTDHSTSVVAGKIYVIGGWNAIGEWNPQWEALTRVDEYDPITDTWTRKADMPTVRGDTSTCVVNDKIYVFGDLEDEPVPVVEVYDPATDTWAEQTELPTKRLRCTTSVVDGVIYVIGGSDTVSRTGLVEAYDPTTDTWMQKADMPTVKTRASSCVVDGKIYVIGGAWTREVVEAYDPATDTWTTKSPMPTPRYGLDTVVVDGKIYAIGGWHHSINGPIYSTVEVYDPVWDTWMKGIDIPVTTAGFSASVVDGKIYVTGGAVATHPGEHWVLTSAVYANEPIVDFNSDGIIDVKDIMIMMHYWGSRYTLCDIGPTPFGDGIVDIRDLLILAEYIEPEEREPGLIEHWKLDETEGGMVYDSVSGANAFIIGEPQWQPDSGRVDGALELNGIDNYISTDFILDPSLGSFSVFAWIQGGVPGQVILSQTDGTGGAGEIWLGADTSEGRLMTGLRPPSGRSPTPPMVADVVITDGQWHHVGIVVTEQKARNLYVDGIRAAFDAHPVELLSSDGGLYIGVGKDLDASSFFSALIDDVRIYDIALTAEEIAAMVQ